MADQAILIGEHLRHYVGGIRRDMIKGEQEIARVQLFAGGGNDAIEEEGTGLTQVAAGLAVVDPMGAPPASGLREEVGIYRYR